MAIDWNVKNANSRDVERQHLNKILADIRSTVDSLQKKTNAPQSDVHSVVGSMVEGNTERGINVSYNAAKKVLDFVITDFTISLTGDVSGTASVNSLGNVSIDTTIDGSFGIDEAPEDGLPYWRINGDWGYVGVALESLANMSGTGFTVIRSNDNWITREFEVVAGELVVTNADGNDGNPIFGLADVVDSNTGTLQGITVDGKGRVTGTTDGTITGTANQIDVANGNAAAGPPTISLSNLADSGVGTFKLITRDAKGRLEGTADGDTDDVPEGTTNLYFTDERAQDSVGNILTDSADIDFTYTDTTPSVSAVLTPAIHASLGLADTAVQSVVAGTNITVDNTDPQNPIVSATGGGSGTVTSVAVADAAGITWAGSPITTSGTFTPTLSANLQAWHGLATSSKLDSSAVSAYMLTVLDDADASAARNTLEAMPNRLVVSGTNVDYTYVAADANVARGKTTSTARVYTVDASVLTVGAYYYAANYASAGNVSVAAAVGTTIRLTGTATTGTRTVGPFGMARIWIRSATEAWVDGPGVT